MDWLMICKTCGHMCIFEEQVSECPECKSTEIRFEKIQESGTKGVSNKVGKGLSDKTKGILGMIGVLALGIIFIAGGIGGISTISPYKECSILWCFECCFQDIPKSSSELFNDYLPPIAAIIFGSFLIGLLILVLIVKRKEFLASHRSRSRYRGKSEEKYDEKDKR